MLTRVGAHGWSVARQAVLLTNRVLFFYVHEKQTHTIKKLLLCLKVLQNYLKKA